MLFAGEAYNVEQGITNEIFPNEQRKTRGARLRALLTTAPIST